MSRAVCVDLRPTIDEISAPPLTRADLCLRRCRQRRLVADIDVTHDPLVRLLLPYMLTESDRDLYYPDGAMEAFEAAICATSGKKNGTPPRVSNVHAMSITQRQVRSRCEYGCE